jgi:hypothetical protein
MSEQISEDVLRGVDKALEIYAPHLRQKLHSCMRGGLVGMPQAAMGSSVYATLTSTISAEDGEQILRALEAIETNHGFQTKFAGRQINFLILCWRQFAQPKQLPPESKAR